MMDSKIFNQLLELTQALNGIGVKPLICGGLGIYLCFSKRQGEAQHMIRATKDIDLMLTQKQVLEQSYCNAIAEIITGRLNYVVCEEGKFFRFFKNPDQQLDIIAPPINGFRTGGGRVKFVRSKLHGRITNEACFIEEDLRTIHLSDLPGIEKADGLEVQVPSPTNLLIMKLFAFHDRDQGSRENEERAQAHAWDIYIAIMLTNRDDYIEAQRFLSRHEDSDIIQGVWSIVSNNFSAFDQAGWRRVLEASNFYPNLNRQEKEQKLDVAKRRLVRWFTLSVDEKTSSSK